MGIKGPDTWAAYGCSSCHDEMDRRTSIFFGDMDDEDEQAIRLCHWAIAIRETQDRLIAKGLLKT